MLKVLCFILVLLNIFSYEIKAISAKSYILIDAKSGRTLCEGNSHEKMPMASTTKIMTALLACENGVLTDDVIISPFASSTEGSSLWTKPGEKYNLHNLIYGLMLKSGNDSAVAIAEHLSGSVDAFSLLMNKRAGEIGAKDTNFRNPHGLDDPEHYTTSYDLALITREALKNKDFAQIVSTKKYTFQDSKGSCIMDLKNHNKLLWRYEGCNGVKTGYTKKCGRCLVSSASRNDEQLICVTLNAPDDWNDHTYLLNYGFENFDSRKIAEKNKKVCEYTFKEYKDRKLKLVFGENYEIMVNEKDIITTTTELKKLCLPVKKGDIAGTMNVYLNGEPIKKIPVLASEDIVEKSAIKKMFGAIITFFKDIIDFFF